MSCEFKFGRKVRKFICVNSHLILGSALHGLIQQTLILLNYQIHACPYLQCSTFCSNEEFCYSGKILALLATFAGCGALHLDCVGKRRRRASADRHHDHLRQRQGRQRQPAGDRKVVVRDQR